jgi:Protein of unknown function (DUF3048) N-terminal domain/Protein of unknown function (DUF3048) C-terminal domain
MRKFVVTLGVLVVLAAGGFAAYHFTTTKSATGPSATSTTTTTAPNYPDAPLTGLPDPSGTALTRPALTIKVENTPQALPQWGINEADVVYEEIVNGGITRLAAVFNSQAPGKVGPVRSVRPTDTQVVWPLGGIFAYSGGAPYAVDSIETVPSLTLVNETQAGDAMFRDNALEAPHNLFARTALLFAFKGRPTPPPALFHYRTASDKVVGPKVASVVVPFPSIYPVTWTWDTSTLSWDRTLFGNPDVTGTGQRESPQNVVVMYVNYVNGIGTENSYADLQGSGTADVFTDGREITGSWSRGPSQADVITYHDAAGSTILLTSGQTWVEILNDGVALTITK